MIPLSILNRMSDEEMNKYNFNQIEYAKEQHNDFLDAFEKGYCNLCGMKISYFSASEPCFHWFLYPDGLRKKHLKSYLKDSIGFFQLESYLRWVANTDGKFKNINDLTSERKLIETTIKYKNLEWSFNFGRTDFEGHGRTQNGDFPHFHMQIIKDNKIDLKFGDCHIPFSNHDIELFNRIENDPNFEHLNLFGEGISVVERQDDLKRLDQEMVPCESEDDATFHTRSFFEMPEGEGLSIERLNELYRESKRKGIPLRKCMKEKIPEIKIASKVSPGKGVVEKKRRPKRK